MDSIWIRGKRPLYGEMTVQGSKNAVLPILASTILIAGKTTLRNCPDISDVDCMCRILQKIGATVTKKGHEICVDASGALQSRLPAEEVVRMRSSIVLTGALLGRLGQASFCDPGGCVIGDRPIDLHLKAFARFGCQIRREDDNFLTVFAKRLNGVQIPFPFSSVGATQNAILCAVCAKGETVLTGCAKEPEVVSLCRFLNGAGAKIEGAGSKTIRIEGVKKLYSTEFSIDADRIVAGTCLIGDCSCQKNGRTDCPGFRRTVGKTYRQAGFPAFAENGRISGLSDRPAVPDADGTVLRRRKLYGVGARF